MNDKGNNSKIERRHLTVLECDLVGSTALAHRMDPEDFGELIVAYRDCVMSWINKLDGYFAQFAGDATWVYFGYPSAHEDDAIRAIRAGLGMLDDIRSIELHGVSLNARVGIASGLCVVGNLRQRIQAGNVLNDSYVTAIGDPPNLAARLQAAVNPGSVAVADETHTLARNIFNFDDLGYHELKGFSEKIRVWRVIDQIDEPSRFKALRPRPGSRLVGRDREFESARLAWNRARAREGQVIYIAGDPGIGKSRLVAAMHDEFVTSGASSHWLHCNELLQTSAFAPVISLLTSLAGIKDTDTYPGRYKKLTRVFPGLQEDALTILAEFLDIDANAKTRISISPARRLEYIYQTLLEIVESISTMNPFLFIIEDMHWVDPSTQVFLERLIEGLETLPILMLITTRNSRVVTCRSDNRHHVETIHLDQLSATDCHALLNMIWGEENAPPDIASNIVGQSDGVPLYIEELAISHRNTALVDANSARRDAVKVPVTLNDHLMSRIDNLGKNRTIAQIGSVIGREFNLDMIVFLTGMNSAVTRQALADLVDSGLFIEQGREDCLYYDLKHTMIREVAYNSLLVDDRKQLHARIADWFLENDLVISQSQPETLAYHYEQAGQYQLATRYWLEAGKRAKSRSNYVEATRHLANAEELLADSEPSGERDRIALEIKTTQAATEASIHGISSAGAGRAYDEARLLCKKLNYPDNVFPVLSGAGSFHFLRSNFKEVTSIAKECLQLSGDRANLTGKVIGNRILGAVNFMTADYFSAIRCLNDAIETYDIDPDYHSKLALSYAMDHKTSALCYLALSEMVVGNTGLSLELANQSLAHAKKQDLHSTNYALCYLAGLHYFRDDPAEMTREVASESLELSARENYASWTGMSRLLKGEAEVRLGNVDEGLNDVRTGLAEHGNVMAQSFLPFAQSVLARACLLGGQLEEAEDMISKAEALSKKTRQNWYLPEIYRLYAEILLVKGEKTTAENFYLEGITSASSTGATFWLAKLKKSIGANHLDFSILELDFEN